MKIRGANGICSNLNHVLTASSASDSACTEYQLQNFKNSLKNASILHLFYEMLLGSEQIHILNRAIFYVCRMLSSQKEREFVKLEYNEIKQVYSIWICMNRKKNSLEHIHFTKESLIGEENWKGRLDMLNIIMIGLAEEIPEQGDEYELHRLLGTLFSQTLGAEEKIRIVEKEYHMHRISYLK